MGNTMKSYKLRSKKAMIFHVMMVIVTFTVLLFALSMLDKKYQSLGGPIGSKQAEIFNAYAKGENILLYIDQAAKLSAEKAIYDLGQKSGFSLSSSCGVNSRVLLWQKGAQECYPDIYSNFNILFNQNMDIYLGKYPKLNIPKNNYNVLIYNNQLIGTAIEPLTINIYEQIANTNVVPKVATYSIKPSFNIKFSYNTDIYIDAIEQAKILFNDCNQSSDLNDCVTTHLTKPEYSGWSFKQGDNEKVFLFEIKTGKKVKIYTNSLEEKEINVKFGIDFS
jgi:hypothetical protein